MNSTFISNTSNLVKQSEKVLPEIFVVIQSIADHKFIWKDKLSLSWEFYYFHIKLKCIVKIIDKLMQTWNLKAHVVRNIVGT